jgi:hypothetical protein
MQTKYISKANNSSSPIVDTRINRHRLKKYSSKINRRKYSQRKENHPSQHVDDQSNAVTGNGKFKVHQYIFITIMHRCETI